MRSIRAALSILFTALFTFAGLAMSQVPAPPEDIKRLLQSFNDDQIPFNDKPLIIGQDSAKITAILFYAPSSEDGQIFMRRVFPTLKEDYVDKGKLRLVIMDYPLNWKDMQALAGLRCLPAGKHLEAILRTARDDWTRTLFNMHDFNDVPRRFTQLTGRFDLPEDQAIKCMRNLGVLGHVEGLRRLAVEAWNIQESPALAVGGEVLRNISAVSARPTIDFLRKQGME
jgi:hypothetical protein